MSNTLRKAGLALAACSLASLAPLTGSAQQYQQLPAWQTRQQLLPKETRQTPPQDGRHIQSLAGRWTGTGLVQWKNGSQEPYNCIVTYFLDDAGARVKQNLRCSGQSGKLDLATLMLVNGEAITGTWEERTSLMRGDVKGRVTSDGFEATAQNSHFNARFEIAMQSLCEQTVIITPNRQIQQITATLKKSDGCR